MHPSRFVVVLVVAATFLCAATSANATERFVYEAFPSPESEVEETGNLYVMEDGGEPQALELWGQNPSLDTRGRLIAYYENHKIYVTDYHGRATREIVNLGISSTVGAPQWLPGKGLVVDGTGNIGVLDYGQRSGFAVVSEVKWPGRQWAPAPSPDGEKIAFLSETNPKGESLEWPAVYVSNLDGSNPVQITDPESMTPVGSPTFSPDGSSLAFSAFGEFNEWEEGDVVSVSLSTGEPTRLTAIPEGIAWDPDWVSDGRILFTEEYWNSGELEFLAIPEGGGELDTILSPFTNGEWGFHISGRQPVSWGPMTSESINLAKHLLYLYAPTLKYDTTEKFRATTVSSIFETYSGLEPSESNRLIDDEENVIQHANPKLNTSELSIWLESQGNEYPTDFITVQDTDRLDERDGGYSNDAAPWQENWKYGDISYGRAVYAEGHWWLQYWLWYYYDEFNLLGALGDHEGDWEMIQLQLGEYGNPQLATYAQHHDDNADTCNFDILNWTVGAVPNISPIVYVANGRHASYVRSGVELGGIPFDHADGEGYVGRTRAVDMFEEVIPEVIGGDYSRNWSIWPGRWGNSLGEGESPMAPISQGQKWDEPGAFAEQAESCPEEEEGTPQARVKRPTRDEAVSPHAPVIKGMLKKNKVVVHYVLPVSQRSDQRQGIEISVLAQSRLVTPVGKTVWRGDEGNVVIPVPSGAGPSRVIARTLWPNGLVSHKAEFKLEQGIPGRDMGKIVPARTSIGAVSLYGLRVAKRFGLGSPALARRREQGIRARDRRLRRAPLPIIAHALVDKLQKVEH